VTLEAGGCPRVPADIEFIAAPSNLGLRPPAPDHEPGVWRAPAALLEGGLQRRVRGSVTELHRPRYEFHKQPATGIRNGVTIREHALTLADAVERALRAERFPVVLGGDCSILLGCLLGTRRREPCGLVHLDGHSDFYHPGNYPAASRLGSAAGMDLALATGRGELLLTHWPSVGMPLVADEDVVQIGGREAEGPDASGDALDAPIERTTAQELMRVGIGGALTRALEHFDQRRRDRVWLHVDLDVLDERFFSAVDSPGSPGLSFEQLGEIMAGFVASGRITGFDLTIYDPELDPSGAFVSAIVESVATALEPLIVSRAEALRTG
jgi:arginase